MCTGVDGGTTFIATFIPFYFMCEYVRTSEIKQNKLERGVW